jgi:hypothetical protein
LNPIKPGSLYDFRVFYCLFIEGLNLNLEVLEMKWLGFVLYGTMGSVLSISGIQYDTWNFWAIFAILIASDLNEYFQK